MPRRHILFLVLPLTIGACQTSNQQASIDELFVSYIGKQTPGAAVLVARNNEILLERCFGVADLKGERPVTPNTNFRLASISKQFTALATLQLIAKGTLDFETTLSEIFAEFPAYGDGITIEHLLRHTSGLLDYESLMPDTLTRQLLDPDVLEMMMAQDSTYFVPGAEYRYSNTAYVLLGKIVEKQTGLRFSEYLRTHLFLPMGMDSTVAFEEGINHVPVRAYGYRQGNDGYEFADQSRTSALLGDGGIYSSIRDLLRWDRALSAGTAISPEWLERAWAPGALSSGEMTNYGYGWRIDTFAGHRRTHHTGSTSGFRNVLQRFPDNGLFIVILTNRSEPDVAPLADELARRFLTRDAAS